MNLNKFIEYGSSEENMLLVSSDGTRDLKVIEKFIKENKDGFIISSTYFSVDVISETLKFMDDPIIIVDEFHNLYIIKKLGCCQDLE